MSDRTYYHERERLVPPQEAYRFAFLAHLEVAEKLVNLRTVWNNIKVSKLLLEADGSRSKCYDNDNADALAEAGDALFFRYGMNYSVSGFMQAADQLSAEMQAVCKAENRLFKDVKSSAIKWVGEETTPIWSCGDNAQKHNRLLCRDGLSLARIRYYKEALSKFNEEPLLPFDLEVRFGTLHGGMVHCTKFSE